MASSHSNNQPKPDFQFDSSFLQIPPPPPYEQINRQSAPYSSNATHPQNSSQREQIYQNIINRYEISQDSSYRLQKYLVMTKIVFVYDDSGSMNSILNDSPLNSGVFRATRWDELKSFSRISIDLANIFNPEGIDIHFLNRPAARNVRTLNDLEPYLVNRPAGYTPMRRVLESVLKENNDISLAERRLLIVIVTDGQPTDDSGKEDIRGFRRILERRAHNVYTTIVSCTDEDNVMSYLNNWDRLIPRLDVVDDYRNEKIEIQRAKGFRYPFSYGDYVVKCLIGSLDPNIDRSDERKHCVVM
jgi:hypothetical protein